MKNSIEKIVLLLTAASGPAECQLAAAKTLAHLLEDCRANGLEALVLQRVKGDENGTIQSAVVEVKGVACDRILQPWIGTILWIQKSPYRSGHGRKNWFVGVFKSKPTNAFTWSENELNIQTMRSGGAGGQHVNKVSSAVRITHVPTGISVVAQDSRSQIQNKKIALERIKEKLKELETKHYSSMEADQWSKHYQLERGNPVKVFTGLEFKPKQAVKHFKTKRQALKQQLRKDLNE
jgi:peptide chain release factor